MLFILIGQYMGLVPCTYCTPNTGKIPQYIKFYAQWYHLHEQAVYNIFFIITVLLNFYHYVDEGS